MLQQEIFGNTLDTWGISLLIIVGAVIIVKLLSLLGKRVLEPFIQRTPNRLDNIIYYSLDAPVKFAVMLLGIWIAIHKLVYPDSLVKVVDNAYRILIILDITWICVRLFGGLFEYYWEEKGNGHVTNKMMPVVKRTVLIVAWIVGIVVALSNVGVNISALLGTLGIGGIAFALAAQDTVKNVFGAFTIFTDKPFTIGDTININGFEGTVVDVGIRSTKILGYDKRITTFPNYKVTDTSIMNISSEPMRRVMLKLGLTYDTTPEKMKEALDILRALPQRIQDVSPDPADILAGFTDYTDSSLVITYFYYIKKGGDILKATSDMNMEILSSFSKAGLSFAFPTQTVYVYQDKSEGEEGKTENNPAKNLETLKGEKS